MQIIKRAIKRIEYANRSSIHLPDDEVMAEIMHEEIMEK